MKKMLKNTKQILEEKEMIDLKNQLTGMIFQGERQLKEFEAKAG